MRHVILIILHRLYQLTIHHYHIEQLVLIHIIALMENVFLILQAYINTRLASCAYNKIS